ncbi:NtaA/DmoA family FMN-dependent monooxygenase [Citricoccus sp. NR2]|uniref:NtaA/DmoA family FMN-dependent monooxygenase n=1 Tax=Citricoccus sp. NR2 TaxID=3004095 RepID=UPI0022DD895E|nr:NtaA/DmoA family FMN-dependent monooxygenase [Citricoccus sp. NR2]WBL19917.1 NtaA/DmoA family FMN-dependent monooxygenase [Citricoccus sp. NR2]
MTHVHTRSEIHLNLFATACGHHAAAWRAPDSAVERIGAIEYWEQLAQLAERGCLDAFFLADGQALGPGSAPVRYFDPLTTLAAVARATERIGLVATISSTFWTPFPAARMLASLDHLSGGRAGVNVVTSMTDAEARNHGMDRLPGREQRYARAEEFIVAMQGLWDSWEDGAVRADRDGAYLDAARIHPVDHRGRYFEVAGPLTVPRSPQGRPVVLQAGASEPGRALAARYSEGIYAVAWDAQAGRRYRADLRRRVAAAGRNPDDVVVMPGLVTEVASTEREARARRAELDALLPVAESLRQLSFFVGQDASDWELDAPVPELPPVEEFTGPVGRYATVLRMIETRQPTVRELLGLLAAGGGHATLIGTPEQVAETMLNWVDSGAADGFNLMPPTLPGSLEDVVEQLVPELQRRGRFRREYRETTLRERWSRE